ncbi:MAG: hypothetical protein QOE97_3833 [Pseudonocardiales bacterium]|nr:hypothetical protein [Pseudonocardiales bacterium]
MTTFVLVPGAGGVAWYWSRVEPLLREAGHEPIAVDLPGDDPAAGLPQYVQRTLDAIGGRRDVVMVGQSLGAFTAVAAAARTSVRALVLVNGMIPLPGETAGDWWGNTGSGEARVAAAQAHGYPAEFELSTYFLHDVDPEVAAEGEPYQRPESDAVFGSPCDIDAWPDVPTSVVAGADDRFFPVTFQQRVARERLGVEPTVLPGGHLIALSQPRALTGHLVGAL